jgi:hypothetical protein
MKFQTLKYCDNNDFAQELANLLGLKHLTVGYHDSLVDWFEPSDGSFHHVYAEMFNYCSLQPELIHAMQTLVKKYGDFYVKYSW